MREIKFRAWTGKELLYQKDRDNNFTPNDGFNHLGYRPISALQGDLNDYHWMQFTGLLDKTGVEIYQGDIVQIYTPSGEEAYIKTINDIFDARALSGVGNDYGSCAVIGNIYENGDLLK